jgi:hypothetical protein
MYSLGLDKFVVSDKKCFIHFLIGSYLNMVLPTVAAILDFRLTQKNIHFVPSKHHFSHVWFQTVSEKKIL